ncbi:MAG: hypothetical protein NVV60_01380 [Luteimonas sp.]|nr:hypothetical protein [Luteimonas sp.]
MTKKRQWHPTKAAWAAARATELRQQADALPSVPASDWRGVSRRMRSLTRLHRQADALERLARPEQDEADDLPF